MDHVDIIKHCKKEIENAENEIKELEKSKSHISNNTKNMELVNKLKGYAESKKEVYQTLLNDLKEESQ